MDNVKGNTRRAYLSDEDMELLKQISVATGLSQVEVLTQVIHAGLGAIEDNGRRISLPLRFETIQEQMLLREKTVKTYKK